MYTLPDVWIRPNFGGKGRKVTGQLEAHQNGFRYSSPKGESLDIMYRSVPAFLFDQLLPVLLPALLNESIAFMLKFIQSLCVPDMTSTQV